MPTVKKGKIIDQVKEKLLKSNFTLFTDYRGLKVKDMESLKNEIRTDKAEYEVVKNTLLRVASKEKPAVEEKLAQLEGPTAVMFCYEDEIAPLKKLLKFAKLVELPKIKFALLKEAYLSDAQIQQLATLPSKEVLLGQVVGAMSSPLYRLRGALTYHVQGFAYQINQLAKQKENT